MKNIVVSGMKLYQIEERHKSMSGLKWEGNEPPSYQVIVFPKKDDTGGIIALSDSFGGGISWARFQGKNPFIGKVHDSLSEGSEPFLKESYPELYRALINLDA